MAKLLGLVLITVLAIALYTEAKPIEDVTVLVLADEGAPTTEEPAALSDGAETTYAPSYDEVTGGKGLNLDSGDETTTSRALSNFV